MRYLKIISVFIFINLINIVAISAQKNNSEYRYFSIKLGLVNNFVAFPEGNNNLVARTPVGDLPMSPRKIINYTPGAAFSFLFNFDAKNDKFGIVTGIEARNFGYSIQYASRLEGYYATDMFRSTSLIIPVYIKYNPRDVFINQSYVALGFKEYINFNVIEYQTSTWDLGMNIRRLTQAEINRMSPAFFLGLNYNLYYLNLEYSLRSFINKDFKAVTQDGVVRPFSNIDYRMNLFLTAGVNLPLNRWLTMRSWMAERIRRLFTPVR
jgi:hypothetical protein